MRYADLLTLAGMAEKLMLTSVFLRWKMVEYEELQKEIEQLKSEFSDK